MLTIFACPKPFTNPHIAIIQRNAIISWTLLRPRPEIILFGDEEGVAQICQELGLRHIPEIARNEYGTPLLNDIFEKAQRLASYDILCYVNADIILMSDLIWAVECVEKRQRRFLMVGGCWDLDIREAMQFENPGWEKYLRCLAKAHGSFRGSFAMDFFVFPGGLLGTMPPFALGRPAWDNWLLYWALKRGVSTIDATAAVVVVHQRHDYAHVPGGSGLDWTGVEAEHNIQLAGGGKWVSTLEDVTWKLTLNGKITLNWTSFRRLLWYGLLGLTRPVRHRLGLRKAQWDRPKA